jgi:hypothetical protein
MFDRLALRESLGRRMRESDLRQPVEQLVHGPQRSDQGVGRHGFEIGQRQRIGKPE